MANDLEDLETAVISPFTIEIDHPRNSPVMLQTITNLRIRSAFDGMKPAKDATGVERVPIDQALAFAGCPRMPGQRITVNPIRLTYEVTDPLHGNKEACDKFAMWLKSNGRGLASNTRLDGEPPKSGELDIHQMKTLCRELLGIVQAGWAKLVVGRMPTEEEIASMKGRFILDPGLRIPSMRPKFEDELDSWKDGLSRAGA